MTPRGRLSGSDERELEIEATCQAMLRLAADGDAGGVRAQFARMRELISRRSTDQVRRMEAERGLR